MSIRAQRWLPVLAVALLLTACTTAAGDSATTSTSATASSSTSPSGATSASSSTASPTSPGSQAPSAPAEITPVLVSVSTEPSPVTGTDGAQYLAYELYLTNITSTAVTVDSVQALNADGGAVVQEKSGTDLLAHFRSIGAAADDPAPTSVVLAGGRSAIIWLDPHFADPATVPAALSHTVQLTFESAPNPLIPAELTEHVAVTAVSRIPAAVIASPLAGTNWFDGNGCCDAVTPHRGAANPIDGKFYFAERFAIDWVQLDANRQYVTGDPTQLTSYAYYGAPIHAVADGEIVGLRDDLPDEPPGASPPVGALTLDQYAGNHVVEKFTQGGNTYYALYAHLQPGSTAGLAVGQQLTAGEVIGKLGNSGNSDAPHLHFHLMDGPDPLASNGLPFEFDSFQLVGQASGDAAVDALIGGQPLPLSPDGATGTRDEALPLYLDLVDLTPAGSAGSAGSAPESTS